MAYGTAGVHGSYGPRVEARKPIPEALTPEEVTTLGERYLGRDRALFYFLYLSGARIIEALRTKARDIEKKELPPWGQVVTVRLLTVKNRRTRFRVVPVLMKQTEGPMVDYIYNYIGEDPGPDSPIFPELTKRNAWNRLARESVTVRAVHGKRVLENFTKKVNPHYLRHCRLTHLVQFYGFNDTQLTRFAGWTNSEPAQIYVHLNWMDLAKAMGHGNSSG